MRRTALATKETPVSNFRAPQEKPLPQLVVHNPSKEEKTNLMQVARECVGEANGDAMQAAVVLRQRMDNDMELYKAVVDPLIVRASYSVIQRYFHTERNQYIWRAPNDDGQGNAKRVEYLGVAHSQILFDFRLNIPGMPRLGDATKAQVLQAATAYLKQATDMRQKGNWLSAIAKLLTSETKSVQNQVPYEDLVRLEAEAKAE